MSLHLQVQEFLGVFYSSKLLLLPVSMHFVLSTPVAMLLAQHPLLTPSDLLWSSHSMLLTTLSWADTQQSVPDSESDTILSSILRTLPMPEESEFLLLEGSAVGGGGGSLARPLCPPVVSVARC